MNIQPKLLQAVARVKVLGVKKFILTQDVIDKANIGWTDNNFEEFFLGKVEEDVKDAVLVIYSLKKDSLSVSIIAKLGKRDNMQLAYFFGSLKKQSNGEEGPLLTDGYANVAFIQGKDSNVWAMDARYHPVDGYWGVFVNSVEDMNRWNDAGCYILSCKSKCITPSE